MKNQITPGDWRYRRDTRTGPSGNKHADLFIIESDTRGGMATLEVWEMNHDPKWRAANPDKLAEHAETLVEVEANAKAIAAVPALIAALNDLCRCVTLKGPHGVVCLATGQERIDKARAALAIAGVE